VLEFSLYNIILKAEKVLMSQEINLLFYLALYDNFKLFIKLFPQSCKSFVTVAVKNCSANVKYYVIA